MAAIDSAVKLVILTAIGMGLAYIAGESEISYPLRTALARAGRAGRKLVALLECPVCFGFWVGVFLGAFWPGVFMPIHLAPLGRFWGLVFMGVLVAGLNLLATRRLGMFVPSYEHTEPPSDHIDITHEPPAEPTRPEGT